MPQAGDHRDRERDDEEIHARARGRDEDTAAVADEACMELFGECDSAEELHESRGGPEDPPEVFAAGAAVMIFDHYRQAERRQQIRGVAKRVDAERLERRFCRFAAGQLHGSELRPSAHRRRRTKSRSRFRRTIVAEKSSRIIATSRVIPGSGTLFTARFETYSGSGRGWSTSSLSPPGLRTTSWTAMNDV